MRTQESDVKLTSAPVQTRTLTLSRPLVASLSKTARAELRATDQGVHTSIEGTEAFALGCQMMDADPQTKLGVTLSPALRVRDGYEEEGFEATDEGSEEETWPMLVTYGTSGNALTLNTAELFEASDELLQARARGNADEILRAQEHFRDKLSLRTGELASVNKARHVIGNRGPTPSEAMEVGLLYLLRSSAGTHHCIQMRKELARLGFALATFIGEEIERAVKNIETASATYDKVNEAFDEHGAQMPAEALEEVTCEEINRTTMTAIRGAEYLFGLLLDIDARDLWNRPPGPRFHNEDPQDYEQSQIDWTQFTYLLKAQINIKAQSGTRFNLPDLNVLETLQRALEAPQGWAEARGSLDDRFCLDFDDPFGESSRTVRATLRHGELLIIISDCIEILDAPLLELSLKHHAPNGEQRDVNTLVQREKQLQRMLVPRTRIPEEHFSPWHETPEG